MCGIAGIFGPGSNVETMTRMIRVLGHRGPDDEGVWFDPDARISLGHRRLSIIDLSPAGHQPMVSPAGRYIITFNGEIYNHLELRSQLAAARPDSCWRGHSDTETLLGGFDQWGIKATLQRASGMFALAIWDRQRCCLSLARDRLGEKPLYYGRQKSGGPFLFASELNALREHPDFDPEIDREALGLYVLLSDVPAPLSIYRGISKLTPGSILTLSDAAAEPFIEQYWSGAEVARSGAENRLLLDANEAADELERLLEGAVGRQMMADVPLGAFLSGGIDSSTVVAMMQKASSRPVKTFTIGFHEKDYNEAEQAKAVANHLGTEHTELYVTARETMDVIPKLPAIYDEPFADSSQIPTYLVSALARRQVSVALSGDGGDELFGGYDRYLVTQKLWNRIAHVPTGFRAALARGLMTVPVSFWTKLGDAAGGRLSRMIRMKRIGDKVHKGAGMLCSKSLDELYGRMLSIWPVSANPVAGAPLHGPESFFDPVANGSLSGVERMMANDMVGYLPNDILAKVDRAAMSVSLETRVPLLDPELVRFAWRMPLDMKIRGSQTKWLLRQVLYRHVPAKLIDRPKMGFAVPLDGWMRGPLRDWIEALLDERRLREEGFFQVEDVKAAWSAHLKGQNNQAKLWTIIMFQSWQEAQKSKAASYPAPRARAS